MRICKILYETLSYFLLRSIDPFVSYNNINTLDRQCRIKSFFIYQEASTILFTLQSCEECSEGNRTKKKK